MMNAIVAHLWQSTVCVAVAWLLTLTLKNNAARVRYRVWMAASVKFLIPFSLLTALGNQFSWRTATLPRAADTFAAVVQQIAEPLGTPAIVMRAPELSSFNAVPWLVGAWVLISAALLTRWLFIWLRIKRIADQATAAPIHAPIDVKFSSVLSEPGVLGILRPVLLLPQGITERLAPAQLQAVLAHELCHVRRRDNLTAAVHMVVEALFWFHPLVWWIGARLVEERERACDEAVVDMGNEPQAYAEGILKMCQFYMESKLACVAGVSGANLKKRVAAIMSGHAAASLSVWKKTLLCTAAAIVSTAPFLMGLTIVAPDSASAQISRRATLSDNFIIDIAPTDQVVGRAFREDLDVHMPDETVSDLIAGSYHLAPRQIVDGPAWIYSAKYHVAVGSSGPQPPPGELRNDLLMDQFDRLVRSVLDNRFYLKLHREVRRMPAYVLSLSDQGVNRTNFRQESPDASGPLMKMRAGGRNTFPDIMIGAPAHAIAARLSRTLDAIVLDHTGLVGTYAFQLHGDLAPSNLPTLLEDQLGLVLEQRIEPVEMLVIDSVQLPIVDAQAIPKTQEPPPNTNSPHADQAAPGHVLEKGSASDQFKGERMNMRFRDQEVREVFQTIALESRQQIVVDPRIGGRITIAFLNVPWDQALDYVIQAKGLAMRRDGTVIYVAPH